MRPYLSVERKRRMRKAVIVFVLALIVPLCLYADRNFTLSHTIESEVSTFSCSPVFWEALSDAEIIGEKTISSGNILARLALAWEGTGSVGVKIGFSSLYYYGENGSTLDSGKTMDYGLVVKIPTAEDPTIYDDFTGTVTGNSTINYEGSSVSCRYVVDLYPTSSPYSVGASASSGVVPVAAFVINLTGAASAIGMYKGVVYAVVTAI